MMIYLSLQTKRSVQEKKNKKGKNSTDLYQKKTDYFVNKRIDVSVKNSCLKCPFSQEINVYVTQTQILSHTQAGNRSVYLKNLFSKRQLQCLLSVFIRINIETCIFLCGQKKEIIFCYINRNQWL